MVTVVLERPQAFFAGKTRPWLALYNQMLKPKTCQAKEHERELSLIEKSLPPELLQCVLSHLPAASLAAAQCVCKQWASIGAAPSLWREACREAFYDSDAEANAAMVRSRYGGCWKRMLMERPHLRFDGIYVSRNTYLKQGVVEWRVKNAVHLVVYFRYLRFLPDGTFLYRTTPHPPKDVHRSLLAPPRANRRQTPEGEHINHGRFRLHGDRVLTAMRYSGSYTTEIRSRLRLRSTVRGAHNRLDIQAIVSYNTADQTAANMMAPPTDDDEAPEGALQHRRGTTTYVFLPFDQVSSTPLNLPLSQMDVWLPG